MQIGQLWPEAARSCGGPCADWICGAKLARADNSCRIATVVQLPGLPGQRASYGGRQFAAVGSVLVDVGVVDRNLQSGRLARGDGRAQDGYPVVPGEPVWARVVDGLHDRLIEDVCVQVDPEPVGRPAVTGQEGHSLAGSDRGAGLADML